MNRDIYWMIIDVLAAMTFLLFAGGAALLFKGKSATVALFNEWIGTSTAITMARSSAIESRICAILDASRKSGTLSAATAVIMVIVAVAIIAPVAALRGQRPPAVTPPAVSQPAEKTVRYSGQIVSPDGKPVAGADVVLVGRVKDASPYAELGTTQSAIDGSFTIDAPAPRYEDDYRIMQCWRAGFGVAAAKPEPGMPCELQLTGAMAAKVQFLDPQGQPVKGLRITPFSTVVHNDWLTYTPGWGLRFTKTTDADGTCVFDMAPKASSIRFDIDDDRFAAITTKEDIQTGVIPQKAPIVIHLRPAAVIMGKVTFAASGAPAVGFRLHAVARRSAANGVGATVPIVTNERGEYRMPRVNEGTYVIHLFPHGDDQEDIGWTAESLKDVHVAAGATVTGQNLALVKGTVVRGRIYASDTNELFAGQSVTCIDLSSNEFPGGQRTDANGNFAIRVPPGRIGIRLSGLPPDGYTMQGLNVKSRALEITAVNGVDQTVDLTLIPRPGRPIVGRVVDADGKPVAGAIMTVNDDTQSDLPHVRTGADGKFRFRAVRKGATLSVYAGNAGTLAPVEIPDAPLVFGPPPKREDELVIHLVRNVMTTVSGSVIDSSDKPVANAAIYTMVMSGGSGIMIRIPVAYTDVDGHFSIKACAGAATYMQIEADSHSAKQLKVEFTAGEAHHDMGKIVLDFAPPLAK